jgi:hypothetical protein
VQLLNSIQPKLRVILEGILFIPSFIMKIKMTTNTWNLDGELCRRNELYNSFDEHTEEMCKELVSKGHAIMIEEEKTVETPKPKEEPQEVKKEPKKTTKKKTTSKK